MLAETQAELPLPRDLDEDEQARETRLHSVLLRLLAEAAEEVGRKNICYALDLSEQLLSKQVREIDDKRPSYRLIAYCVKHQKSGRLARWLLADYAGYLPPQRPDLIDPEDFAREVVGLALAGEVGNSAKEKIVHLYSRMKKGAR